MSNPSRFPSLSTLAYGSCPGLQTATFSVDGLPCTVAMFANATMQQNIALMISKAVHTIQNLFFSQRCVSSIAIQLCTMFARSFLSGVITEISAVAHFPGRSRRLPRPVFKARWSSPPPISDIFLEGHVDCHGRSGRSRISPLWKSKLRISRDVLLSYYSFCCLKSHQPSRRRLGGSPTPGPGAGPTRSPAPGPDRRTRSDRDAGTGISKSGGIQVIFLLYLIICIMARKLIKIIAKQSVYYVPRCPGQ